MPTSQTLPNIVFIMADDMGYGDVGCFNPDSRIPTPNMDRLAAEGVRFHDAHSSSAVCTPSRYSVLTGRYCWRSPLTHGVLYGYEPPLIEQDRLTVASLLKQSGYHTACVGKWHLGLGFSLKPGEQFDFDADLPWGNARREDEEKIDFAQPLTGGPTELGFDYFYGTAGCGTAQPPYGFIENDRFVEPPTRYIGKDRVESRPGMASASWDAKEVDLVTAGKAVAYIESRAASASPFFLYLTPSAPHAPCCERSVPELAHNKSRAGWRGDMVWLVDWMVGRVMDALDRTGKSDNTLIVVTSDNGALPGDGGNKARGAEPDYYNKYVTYGHKSCGDWRGYKAHIWEGGHREPLVARWPGRIPAGSATSQLVCLSDLTATCAAITGQALPAGAAEDSVDLLPLLLDPTLETPLRRDLVHHSVHGHFAVRQDQWKCIFNTQGSGGWPPPRDTAPEPDTPGQLYNLAEDPAEQINLWDAESDRVKAMRQILASTRG